MNAADLNIGAFDPFEEMIPIAHEAGAWVHVDGAFGLISRVSPKYKHFTRGIEMADSWATDAHKWLNVPFDCGVAFVRDRDAHRASMTVSASYIAPEGKARDQIDWNPEWSRKARGVPVYAVLKELGRSGLGRLIETCCDQCRAIVSGIGELKEAEIVGAPTLNQGLVRFVSPQTDPNEEENDHFTDTVIQQLNRDGVAFFSGTTWKGRRAMRVSVVNWRTNERDVANTIKAVTLAVKKATIEQVGESNDARRRV